MLGFHAECHEYVYAREAEGFVNSLTLAHLLQTGEDVLQAPLPTRWVLLMTAQATIPAGQVTHGHCWGEAARLREGCKEQKGRVDEISASVGTLRPGPIPQLGITLFSITLVTEGQEQGVWELMAHHTSMHPPPPPTPTRALLSLGTAHGPCTTQS